MNLRRMLVVIDTRAKVATRFVEREHGPVYWLDEWPDIHAIEAVRRNPLFAMPSNKKDEQPRPPRQPRHAPDRRTA